MKNNWTEIKNFVPVKTGVNISFQKGGKYAYGIEGFAHRNNLDLKFNPLFRESNKDIFHTHEFPEIFLVLSGRVIHCVNGEEASLSAGSLVFVRPLDSHFLKNFNHSYCEIVNFAFSIESLMDLSIYLENDHFMKKYTASVLPPTFNISINEADKTAMQLLEIKTSTLLSVENARIKVKRLIMDLFTEFFFTENYYSFQRKRPSWMKEVLKRLEKPSNLQKGLIFLRENAPCTEQHLCKIFKKYLFKTPTEYINELRMTRAAKMLRNSNETLSWIAGELGIESTSRFHHLFKRSFGLSPGEYRKTVRERNIQI